MVEYLPHKLKVEGSRPACAQILFRYTAGKFRWRRKLNRKFRPTRQNFFCYMYELSQRHPVWVAEINVTACNSAGRGRRLKNSSSGNAGIFHKCP
jgi:hypothetical protein